MKKVYKKFDSFVGFRSKKKPDLNNLLEKIKFLLNNKKNIANLKKKDLNIIKIIKEDLFGKNKKKEPTSEKDKNHLFNLNIIFNFL